MAIVFVHTYYIFTCKIWCDIHLILIIFKSYLTDRLFIVKKIRNDAFIVSVNKSTFSFVSLYKELHTYHNGYYQKNTLLCSRYQLELWSVVIVLYRQYAIHFCIDTWCKIASHHKMSNGHSNRIYKCVLPQGTRARNQDGSFVTETVLQRTHFCNSSYCPTLVQLTHNSR